MNFTNVLISLGSTAPPQIQNYEETFSLETRKVLSQKTLAERVQQNTTIILDGIFFPTTSIDKLNATLTLLRRQVQVYSACTLLGVLASMAMARRLYSNFAVQKQLFFCMEVAGFVALAAATIFGFKEFSEVRHELHTEETRYGLKERREGFTVAYIADLRAQLLAGTAEIPQGLLRNCLAQEELEALELQR